MNYQIRKSTKEDVKAVCEVHVNSWKETYTGLMPDSVISNLKVSQKRIEMWEKMIPDDGNFETYVATIDNKVIGFTGFGKAREGDDNFVGEIGGMYLLRAYQKQGIGKALFETAVQGLKKRGFKSFYLRVLKGNSAENFYQHMGGILDSESEETYGDEKKIISKYIWTSI